MRVGPRSDRINEVWYSGDYTGMFRPAARVTLQRCSLLKWHFPPDVGGDARNYQTINFLQPDPPREMPNVKSIRINRATDLDAATATITFINSQEFPSIGYIPKEGLLDRAGWYTFNRGMAPNSYEWDMVSNSWINYLREDRILRTYQGYGMDPTVAAELDTNLIQTGTWLIDDVDIDSDGDIVCTCRDLAALLLDQHVYPPIVPLEEYPLYFEKRHSESTTVASAELPLTAVGSSNDVYGFDPYGHSPRQAFDEDISTYWLSVGNSLPSADYSYEWIEAAAGGGYVGEVRFTPWAGNYTVFVSIKIGGVWQGALTIPYNPNSAAAAPNGANIPYIWSGKCDWEKQTIIPLSGFDGVERIRLTFTNLADSDLGTYQYRAGVRHFEALSGPQAATTIVGNFNDYTDIVKQFCAMGGFYWPVGVPPLAPHADPALGGAPGRVYGDMETAGTGPIVDIPESTWDKKSLMDGITYVKEILGFIFFMDETGGPVFRSPNLWKIGNYTLDLEGGSGTRVRTHIAQVLTIDETRNLMKYKVRLSNRNKRRRFVVGNADGTISAEVPGDESIPVTQYPLLMERYAAWTDQHFENPGEALVMAELIKIRQNFTYRQGSVTMPANPNLQPDDQVRIVERITAEGFLHYITGVTSEYEARSGKYTMSLETFWLGQDALVPGQWVIDPTMLSPETQEYLKRTAKLEPTVDSSSTMTAETTTTEESLVVSGTEDPATASVSVTWTDTTA